MFSTRDAFFDDSPDEDFGGGSGSGNDIQPFQPVVIMPEPVVPSRDYSGASTRAHGIGTRAQRQEDSDDDTEPPLSSEPLMPGAGGGGAPAQSSASAAGASRAAQMQRMQMQARMARGQLAGGMQRPISMMAPSASEHDEFSVRPQSRGGTSMRGPFAPVNTMPGGASGGSGADCLSDGSGGRRSAPLAQISQTEQQLARMGLATEYDPSAEKGAGGGSRASRAAAINSPARPVMDMSDVRGLLNKVPPPNTTIQCYIVRKKKGLFKAFPQYKLYLQQGGVAGGSGEDKFLLSARKRKKQKKSNYLVSLDEEDMAKQSGNYYGKVKSNFIGTEFICFDKGAKPAEAQEPLGNMRKELGVILYDTNVLGTKGPRKMTVHVPPVAPDGSIRAATSTAEGPSLLDNVKSGDFGDSIRLHNKEPRWNESLGAYCLNFNGRVTLPSVKNFQLQMEAAADPNQVSLQFGKTGEDTFSMDYSYPLCPLQAFQIVLSSFDHKWACE